jgi:NAD(P)-dependent dehydrogenase (short-subunit alcohol dehydrogenase family)
VHPAEGDVTVDRLRDKVAIISGGAGSIGAATARLFVAEGAKVVLADLDEAALTAVTDELGADHAAHAATDVTDSAAVRAAVQLAVDRFGGLDVAFANAGVFGAVAPVAEYPEDVFDQVMAVNVGGSFRLAKHALAVMRDGGSLIFNSSIVGLMSEAGIAGYATSKHALVGLMRTAVREVADRGIRVNSIHPGPVANAFQENVEVTVTGQAADVASGLFEEGIALGRHATPDEIARAVLFLAGEDSSFMTGATLKVDGGMLV